MSAPLVLDLPPETLAALRLSARAAGVSPSQHAIGLLSKTLISHAARTPCRAEERPHDLEYLLAPLRALLAADLSRATDWADLQDRLAKHGYTFRERGGGLALFSTTTAARICKASDLGWTYADLIRRFDAPFPGHSHTHVADRVLKRALPKSQNHPSLFPDPGDLFSVEDDDDDLILFEDE
ncbi:hypothetical protein [Jannaschia sp. CCS1]|uniref:hypothetical protein n=1 Tax=Jannaschia sp. (strain CCS1) TaxID=290400 RepID=UPI000053B3DC|nr:hypothetical protein [Jannaschia sp. CCS1]ABD53029.1 hypothetical protein Jann_0112 [Jannaschia sp. CCS1]